eukprot:m.96014 g.96014  ORF g.96014 m.96014 type:complete len:64 (+) comp13525_c0_seq1:317-508(+)
MEAIGFVDSCYKQKFGIPRQPGLVPSSRGSIQLLSDYGLSDVTGLQERKIYWAILLLDILLFT